MALNTILLYCKCAYICLSLLIMIFLQPKYVLINCLLSVCVLAHAQNPDGAGFGIETNAFAGKVFKHTSKFTLPLPALCTANEVNFVWKTYGKKSWQQRVKFPVWGIGLMYTNYGNNAVYGQAIGVYPNLQVPFIKREKWEWTFRMGFGIGFISKHYSRAPDWDTINVAIGSTTNNFSIFLTDLRYHVNQHWDLQAGLNFSHISNGTYHLPNLGINMYGAHIGVRYFPVTSQPVCTIHDTKPLPNRILVQGRFSMGLTEGGAPLGPEYKVFLGTLYLSKRFSSKNKIYAGIDYSYHQDIYAFLRNNEIDPGHEAAHSWKSAVLGGAEFGVGCVGIILQGGVYIHEAALKQDPYYEKVGAHFYLVQKEQGALKELFLSAMLKTHKASAEVAEFGIGFGF
jgi:hypothetical protein